VNDFLGRLERDRFLPVAVVDRAEDARDLAEALAAGGLTTLEVTLRTEAGVSAIACAAGATDVLVGAGTVLCAEQVDRVVEAGAGFVVTPGLDRAVVERCLHHGVPVLPGVATPSEVMAALALGLDTVKLFPAQQLGGPGMAAALAGPFPGLRMVPSGGVDRSGARTYLELAAVPAVSGSWVTGRDAITARRFDDIRLAAAGTVAALSVTSDAAR
jgi:2-dehydro-3-deoxyphosphogluconate aldolase / (4S)-4-hydroxy-2-oxoglutarate aldolase